MAAWIADGGAMRHPGSGLALSLHRSHSAHGIQLDLLYRYEIAICSGELLNFVNPVWR